MAFFHIINLTNNEADENRYIEIKRQESVISMTIYTVL
jgi:hypothetical protein